MTDRQILEELVHLKSEIYYIQYRLQEIINDLCKNRNVAKEVNKDERL